LVSSECPVLGYLLPGVEDGLRVRSRGKAAVQNALCDRQLWVDNRPSDPVHRDQSVLTDSRNPIDTAPCEIQEGIPKRYLDIATHPSQESQLSEKTP
jgi:hypothetical protein